MVNFEDLLVHFQKRTLHTTKEIEFYKNSRDIREAIIKAAECKNSKGKRHSHQSNFSKDVLDAVKSNLLEREFEIASCREFECIHKIVENSRVKGFADLAIYDVAHRIGIFLGILPKRIYLHAGTLKGAKKLFSLLGVPLPRRTYLEVRELPDKIPEKIRQLNPDQLEDFLCIEKDHFEQSDSENFQPKKQARPC